MTEILLSMTLGGSEWVLWLLLSLSVVSLGLILERLFVFKKTRLEDFGSYLENIKRSLKNQDIEKIKALCISYPENYECQMTLRSVEESPAGLESLQKTLNETLIMARQKWEKGLVVLGTLGNNAPFIGLFGTVLGIIKAFHDLGQNPAGGSAVVMAGISEALITTAVGLFVAIPAVMAFNGFQRAVKNRVARAEALQNVLLSHFLKH